MMYLAAISRMLNRTGVTVSIHKITNRTTILINPVSAAEEMIADSFHCYQLHLRAKVYIDSRVCNNL